MARLEHRLAKLEAEAARPPVVFRVRWDDDDAEPPAGPVIRLRWGVTMTHDEKRLRRLEAWRRRRAIAAMAAEVGLTAEELLEEAHEFFALPLEGQLAQVDEIAAALEAEGVSVDGLKGALRREYTP